MEVTDPREKSDKYRKNMTVKFYNGKKFDFLSTQFLIDDYYVGNPPKVQVSFENLNDNIDENFLRRDLERLGKIRTLDIVRHPETKQHLGLARVQFEDPKIASSCVIQFNGKQIMGKQLSVYHDVRFATIERRKEDRMRPQPVINHVETQKIQIPPTPLLPVFAQLPFTPVVSTSPLDVLPRPANRPHAVSLDERLAKMGLKQQAATIPSNGPPPHFNSDKPSIMPFLHNHSSKGSHEKTLDLYPPTKMKVEDEERWDPMPNIVRDPTPTPPPPPEVPKTFLTLFQITDLVIPHVKEKFKSDLSKSLYTALQKRLVFEYGYPRIDQAQREYREEQARQKSERAKQETARRTESLEQKYFNRTRVDNFQQLKQRPQFFRQRVQTHSLARENRVTDHDLKRINRSATLADEPIQQRQLSEDSRSDEFDRLSRSPGRQSRFMGHGYSGSSSRSRSSSSSSVSSSDSSLSGSSSASSSSMSEGSSQSSSSTGSERDSSFKMEMTTELANSAELEAEKALEAATALASLNNQTISQPVKPDVEEAIILKPIPKKRRKKDDQENQNLKRMKITDRTSANDLVSPKKVGEKQTTITFEPRSQELQDRIFNDLYNNLDSEDLKYLKQVHEEWEDEYSNDQTSVPFGETSANMAHLLPFTERIQNEFDSGSHPEAWNGCSRCTVWLTEEGDKLWRLTQHKEEMTYEDLRKAPIKSHVIQANPSTRRDQRSDQRRIAALNPDIDPAFLKHFTANTLQMRAKNLRFSRSKIHMWGLFACEKIANGDAVIEYVGEKIRPSLADHRESHVYPVSKNHDGSSYFFRVDSDVIDASFKGNKARFINHSCNPNCIAKVIKHENGTNSIVIYAKQAIKEDEEITYDYKFPREVDQNNRIRCNCRAPKCHGYLN